MQEDCDAETPTNRDLLLSLVKDVRDMKDTLCNLTAKMNEWDGRIKKVEEETKKNIVQIQSQAKIISTQATKLEDMGKTVEDLYCKLNENNVIVKGIRTKGPNHAYQEVRQLFNQLGGHEPNIANIKPIGIGNNKLIVKFANIGDSSFLFDNVVRLRQQGIGLEKDLPPQLREIRNILLRRRRELIDNGVATTVKVTKDSLLVDGVDWFHYDRKTGLMNKRPKRI